MPGIQNFSMSIQTLRRSLAIYAVMDVLAKPQMLTNLKTKVLYL